MPAPLNRRLWLKQSSFALAGLGLTPQLFAKTIPKTDTLNKAHVPNQTILLNSNENAYGPSPAARSAMLEAYLKSNRYPDDLIGPLKKKLAAHSNVQEDNILLGAGSSEIIGLACLHAAKKKGHILTTEPSYKVWNNQATAFGLSFKRTTLPKKNNLPVEELYGPVTAETRLVYICNPNNPTGTVLDVSAIEHFAQKASQQALIFIDEAYAEYAQLPTLASLAVSNPNVIVAKTFSKIYGLAGARVGYAIAHPKSIQALSQYQPWPDAAVSVVSAAAATAALDDQAFVQDCREKAKQARELCYDTFRQLALEYIPASANFILFNIDKIKGDFAQQMQQQNIYVQFREHYGGKWCRVTMGTLDEMERFTHALKELAA